MTTTAIETGLLPRTPPKGRQAARARIPARPLAVTWSATNQSRDEVWDRLTHAPFLVGSAHTQKIRLRGLTFLLDWLEAQPGRSWQERWLASGADGAGAVWRKIPGRWLQERGMVAEWCRDALASALLTAISADIVRPALGWLVAKATGPGSLVRHLTRTRDPDGLGRLRALCDADRDVSSVAGSHTLYRAAEILAAKGGTLADVTVGDVLELLDVELDTLANVSGDAAVFYRLLRAMGVFSPDAPATLRQIRGTAGPRTPEELIDRYRLTCRPVRDLLVEYLRERQPSLDYSSMESLACTLGLRFWRDLEIHHPGIDSLRLPREVADAWKQRLRTRQKTIKTETGDKVTVEVPRLNHRECLIPVRAFYLDLAHWAVDDPGRWAQWAVPCPVKEDDVNQRRLRRHRKSRMDARTRQRLPVLPMLVRTVNENRKASQELLQTARQTQPGQPLTAAGQTLIRSITRHGAAGKVWAHHPGTGKRRDVELEEDHAFWAWAIVEVLRATGVRVEELLELSHHSFVQYRLPTTGELVPLLQIAPSKTDEERLLLVSPELADVLSTIIRRVRDDTGRIPLIASYDWQECVWLPPSPLLFQRRFGAERRRISPDVIRDMLAAALIRTGLTDPLDGGPLRYTPHDFRRIFITDAIMSGLPPHIAQVIAGHRDINVTMGYKAVYPDEAIQSHLAFLARRRSLRPTEEYRVPTDAEWQEFLGHFERRKVSTGICGRAFGTPCIHFPGRFRRVAQ